MVRLWLHLESIISSYTMSLSRNDMLSTGGNRRRRSRGSCYVNKPAYGFFIAGSSFKAMNGVYVRDNAPTFDPSNTTGARESALYYTHEDDDSGWIMSLEKLPEDEEAKSSSEDEYGYGYHYREPKKKKEYEWVFVMPDGISKFSHDGDTIVPGAGVRWTHIHHTTTSAASAASSDSSPVMTPTPEAQAEETKAETSSQVVKAKEDDENELPWQVIALLDQDIMQQLVWASRRRKQRVQRSMAGTSAPKPGQFTLEGCYVPGRFLYRVVAKEGIQTYSESTLTSTPHRGNTLKFLSYAIGVELGKGGQWLRLDSSKHVPPASSSSRSYYGGYGQTDRYVQTIDGTERLLLLWTPARPVSIFSFVFFIFFLTSFHPCPCLLQSIVCLLSSLSPGIMMHRLVVMTYGYRSIHRQGLLCWYVSNVKICHMLEK